MDSLTLQKCQQCGTPLDHATLDGLCPRCLALDLFTPQMEPAGSRLPLSPGTVPTRVGDYELLEEVARGGMGVVYRARQTSLERVVAVKMIAAGLFASAEAVARFRTEAAAAAGLQHPNIVAIHEVGEHQGQPYFSMDYVAGPTLGGLAREGPLPAKRAAAYLRQVALAVHYAHTRGVLHRDLKPSNVLIDEHDQPRVTDFGLAKFVVPPSGGSERPGTGAGKPAEAGTTTDLTFTGQVLGTPAFMAPEQADRTRGNVTERSDVYGLGAMLYYLVTGRPPLTGESATDVLLQVLNREPVSPRLLNPAVPRDLETLILKCLDKEPARRYATAAAFADELGRFLDGQPIQARPVASAEKAWRWCRRKPAHAVALFLLLVLAVGSPIAAFRINQARQASEQHRREAEANLYVADMNLAMQALEADNRGRAMELLRKHLPQLGQADLRSFDWRYLWRQARDDYAFQLGFHADAVRQLVFSADGQTVASRSVNGTAKVWDVAQRRERLTLTNVFLLGGFSPETQSLAIGTAAQAIQIVDLKTGQRATVLTNAGFLVRWLNDGRTLATTGDDFLLKLWNLQTGQLERTLSGKGGGGHWRGALWDLSIALTPDGKTLASIDKETRPWLVAKVWEVASGRLLRQSPVTPHDIDSLHVSDDGRFVALGFAWSGSFALWDTAKHTELAIVPGHLSSVRALAFSADGLRLVTGATDQLLKVWSVPGGTLQSTLASREHSIWAAAFSPDGEWLATAGHSEPLRFWRAEQQPEQDSLVGLPVLWSDQSRRTRITFSADSQRLALACSSNATPIIDLQTLQTVATISNVACVLRFSEDGERALSIGLDQRVKERRLLFWERTTGSLTALWPPGVAPSHASTLQRFNVSTNLSLLDAAVSPDLKLAAIPLRDGDRIQVLDLITGRELRTFQAHNGTVTDLVLSQAADRLASAGSDGAVKLWQVPSGDLLASFTDHTDGVLDIDVSPDGNLVASSSVDRTVRLWDAPAKRQAALLARQRHPALSVAFSRDGKLLATGSVDGTVTLWSVPLRQELAMLKLSRRDTIEPGNAIHVLAFAPDNNTLAARTADGSVRVWRAVRWEEIAQDRR